MLTILLSLLAGLIGGGIAAWLVCCRPFQRGRSASPDDVFIDPDTDRRIDLAARQWATAHGRPAAAPLVARRLRLIYVLSRGRSRRRRRRRWRWSR